MSQKSEGMQNGAIQGGLAGASTGNPWVAAGGAVLGAYTGWRGAAEKQKIVEAARRQQAEEFARNMRIASVQAKYGKPYQLAQNEFIANARNPALAGVEGMMSGGMLGAAAAKEYADIIALLGGGEEEPSGPEITGMEPTRENAGMPPVVNDRGEPTGMIQFHPEDAGGNWQALLEEEQRKKDQQLYVDKTIENALKSAEAARNGGPYMPGNSGAE